MLRIVSTPAQLQPSTSSGGPRQLTPTNSGMQPRAVQGMLDFDFICKRSTPSVAGIIYTFGGQFVSKM